MLLLLRKKGISKYLLHYQYAFFELYLVTFIPPVYRNLIKYPLLQLKGGNVKSSLILVIPSVANHIGLLKLSSGNVERTC